METVTVFRDQSRMGDVEVEIVGRSNALLGERAYPQWVRAVSGKNGSGGRDLNPGLETMIIVSCEPFQVVVGTMLRHVALTHW